MLIWLVVGVLMIAPGGMVVYLIYRLSAFRKDHPAQGRLGEPYRSLGKLLSAANYAEEGQEYLSKLTLAWALYLFSFGIGSWIIARLLVEAWSQP